MAAPHLRIDADEWVHVWYGESQAPVIVLPPIRIADLLEADGTTSPGT